jgi:hypothetical protein
MKHIIMALVMSAFMSVGAVAATGTTTTTLDGKTFTGKVFTKEDKKGDKDDLEFKNGMLHSTACDQYGFKEGTYTTTTNGTTTTFNAETTSDSGAKMKWTGTVKGTTLHATATWTKDGEPSREMWFDGKIAKAK